MKICLYNVTTGHVRGGLETYCIEMGKALTRRGHQLALVLGDAAQHVNEVGLEVVKFPFRQRSTFADFGTRYRKLMERVSFGRKAWRHLVTAGYDAIIITKPFDFPVLWWARRHGLRAQTLFQSGGADFFPGDRFFSGAVDHWAACSDYTARQIAERYHRGVQVISNGVDTQHFAPGPRNVVIRAGLGVPVDVPLIMSVGRLIGWKGLRIIIEAISQIPEAHYVVIGEGDERARLEEQARLLNVPARVHFLGGIDHNKLPPLLREADVFVQPSIGEEAFGITVIEAMACGLAVVASRNGGMVEIITDGETGVLAPIGDVNIWRNTLSGLLSDRARVAAIGLRARRHAELHFTWDAKAIQTERLLQPQPV
jgi:glycosyltransferase involved in cell wall biosynthesis